MLTSIYSRNGRKGVTLEYEEPATGRLRQKQVDRRTARPREPAMETAGLLREAARRVPRVARTTAVPNDVAYADYADRWLTATKTAFPRRDLSCLRNRRPLPPEAGIRGRPLGEITRADVRRLVIRLRETLKKKTVSNIRGTLHTIFEAAGPTRTGSSPRTLLTAAADRTSCG